MTEQQELPTKHDLEEAYATIVAYMMGTRPTKSETENFKDTPKRATKALYEMVWSKDDIKEELESILSTSFPMESDEEIDPPEKGMITQGPILISSTCPHHLMQVVLEGFVSYIPLPGEAGRVLGLSKLTRLCRTLAKRAVLQEQLTSDIADCLHRRKEGMPWPSIVSQGSAVQLIGIHHCMRCRGVQSAAATLTTELRGVYWGTNLESKLYQAIDSLRAIRI